MSKLEEAGFTTVHLKRKEGHYSSQNLVEMREDLKGYAQRIGDWELGPSKLQFVVDAIGKRDFLYSVEMSIAGNAK